MAIFGALMGSIAYGEYAIRVMFNIVIMRPPFFGGPND